MIRASPALPGATHDITAACIHDVIDTLTAAGVPCRADKAYQGADGTVRLPTAAAGTNHDSGVTGDRQLHKPVPSARTRGKTSAGSKEGNTTHCMMSPFRLARTCLTSCLDRSVPMCNSLRSDSAETGR
ncbi:hypothetical protein GCM10022403_084390 [Streptomyces coacervatus]|uniref:Transposase n=1 Tax=Streptomyces coacervatus TaxID=647381 RepID=A0ABP7JBN5_9ACTN